MPFTYDSKTRTYFKDGRPVPQKQLRMWAAEVLEATRRQMADVTADYLAGAINRPAWFLDMRQLISRSHGAIWLLAQGGREAMTARAWGAAGQKIKREVEYLRGFEREIANELAGSSEQISQRAAHYADALHGSFQAAVVERERAAGVERVVRVLEDGAQHCSDCPDLAGEYDIDEVPAIGDSECTSSCRCEIIPLEIEAIA